MKKFTLIIALIVITISLLSAEALKVAVLSIEKLDNQSGSVAGQIMNRDFKTLNKELDDFELVSPKVTKKAVGKKHLSELGLDEKAEIGKTLGADIIVWGDVVSISGSSTNFKVNIFAMSITTKEVLPLKFEVTKNFKERKKIIEEKVISVLGGLSKGQIDKSFKIGEQNYHAKNYADAEHSFLKVLELDDSHLEANFLLASTYFVQKKYKDAKKYFIKTLSLENNSERALSYLGETYSKLGENDKAIETLERLISIMTDNPDEMKKVWVRIGKEYETSEELENAIEALNSALEIDEEYGLAIYQQAKITSKRANEEDEIEAWEEALPYLQKASVVFPDDPQFSKDLGKAYKKTGKIDSAIEQYLSMIQAKPEDIKLYKKLVSTYKTAAAYASDEDNMIKAKKFYKKAIEYSKIIIEKSSEEISVYTEIAGFYLRIKDDKNAEKFALLAIEKDPNNYKPYLTIADIYQNKGYAKYNDFADVEKKTNSGSFFGEEQNKLIEKRNNLKRQANSLFHKANDFYKKASDRTSKAKQKENIEKKRDSVKTLIKETKKSDFE